MRTSYLHICYWTFLVYALTFPLIFFPLFWYVLAPNISKDVRVQPESFYDISWKAYVGGSLAILLIAVVTGFCPGFPFNRKPKSIKIDENGQAPMDHASADFFHSGVQGLISTVTTMHAVTTLARPQPQTGHEKQPVRYATELRDSYDYEEFHLQPNIELLNRSLNLGGSIGPGYGSFTEGSDSFESSSGNSSIMLYPAKQRQTDSPQNVRRNPFTSTFSRKEPAVILRRDERPVINVSEDRVVMRKSGVSNPETQYATVKRKSSSVFAYEKPTLFDVDLEPENAAPEKMSSLEKSKLTKVSIPKISGCVNAENRMKLDLKKSANITLEEIRTLEDNSSALDNADIVVMRESVKVSPYASFRLSSFTKGIRKSFRNTGRKIRGMSTLNAPEFHFLSMSDGSIDTAGLRSSNASVNDPKQYKSEVDLEAELRMLNELNASLNKQTQDLEQRRKSLEHVTTVVVNASPTPFTKF